MLFRTMTLQTQAHLEGRQKMDYLQMTAPCGLDCFNCAFYVAPENPEARAQIEQWSKEYNIPL